MSAVATLAGAVPNTTVDWHSINWKKVQRTVRRLQARIVKAIRESKWHKVKALVYLLTHSFSGRALAIDRVISNEGAKTPGVDGIVWTASDYGQVFPQLRRHGYRPQPLRRFYIPKKNGRKRPLGIPVMIDRAHQALRLLGLDPIAETLADGHSYGFRQNRRCADAIEQCHLLLGNPRGPKWIMEGDIQSCFDQISKDWLIQHIPMDKDIRGLRLSHEKTKITPIEDGFDFLGQTIRRYPCGKVLVKPSCASVRTFLESIRETIRKSGSWTAGQLIHRLNQQIKGWTMYHRHAASKHTFQRVDRAIFRKIKYWCRRRHQNKSWGWIRKKYYRDEGHRHWIFHGWLPNKDGKGTLISLMEAGRVSIRRYVKIRSQANPYDPEWEVYLENRLYWQLEGTLAGKGRIEQLWKSQKGHCVRCGQTLRPSEKPWHIHHRCWRCHGGSDTMDNLELLHRHCHHQIHYGKQNG